MAKSCKIKYCQCENGKKCYCTEIKKREKCGPRYPNGLVANTYGPAEICNGCLIEEPDDYIISDIEKQKRISAHEAIEAYCRNNCKTLSSKEQNRWTNNSNKRIWFLPKNFVNVMNNHSVYKDLFIVIKKSEYDKYSISNIMQNIEKIGIKSVIRGKKDNEASHWKCKKYKRNYALHHYSFYELNDGTRIPSGISDYVPVFFNKSHHKYNDIRTISDYEHLDDSSSRTVMYGDRKKLIHVDESFIIYDDSINNTI